MKNILLLFFVLSIYSVVKAQSITLVVTNTSETVNGNASNPSALISNPGADGISLSEAIYASYSRTGTLNILFDPALKGKKILLSDNIPTISKGQIIINGDIDGDSKPDISIESVNANSNVCFKISASDVTINGFSIINFPSFGIEASTVQNGYGINAFEKVFITNNEIRGSWAGISISNFEQFCSIKDVEIKQNNIHDNSFCGIQIHAGHRRLSSNNKIINVKVINNSLTNNDKAIYAQGGTFEGSNNNSISDFLISGNRISNHNEVFLLISGGGGLGVQNNKIEGLTISNNICENNRAPMEIIGASTSGDDGTLPTLPDGYSTDVKGNYISNIKIFGNYINGGGIQFVGAYASKKWPELVSSGNKISNVSIGLNTITNVMANGILINSGSMGGSENLIEEMLIFNNLIVKNIGGGIVLTCGYDHSPNNVINDVEIINNTISECGIKQKPQPIPELIWEGGICMNANNQSYYNRIANVRIKNNILWGNQNKDYITGSDAAPTSVYYSIINDPRYKNFNNNYYLNPRFVDPENMNYQLQAGSPAIDRGDPMTNNIGGVDLAGNYRFVDGDNDGGDTQVDLGAYEYNPQITDIRRMQDHNVPTQFNLFQNYPNPFNPATVLKYGIPKESRVKLDVYNVLGQRIVQLVDEIKSAGYYSVKWNGSYFVSGVYIYKLMAIPTGEGEIFRDSKKMILMK